MIHDLSRAVIAPALDCSTGTVHRIRALRQVSPYTGHVADRI